NAVAGTKPNNSFNRSADSAALIENLNLSALIARPVNSGVMPTGSASENCAIDWKGKVVGKKLAQWEQYQEEAASFFRSLGLKAEVNAKKLRGARAQHDVDVWVYGSIYGLEFRWVIECKS